MSDLFKDIVDKAKNFVESGELKEKADAALEGVKEKANDLKESVSSANIKEKAEPVLDKVTDVTSDVLDKVTDVTVDVVNQVKDSVTQIFTGGKAPAEAKNELFDALGEQVAQEKAEAAQQAQDMQAQIEKMLGEDKPE